MEIKKLVNRAYSMDQYLPVVIIISSVIVFYFLGREIAIIMGPRGIWGLMPAIFLFGAFFMFALLSKRITKAITVKTIVPKIKEILPEFERKHFLHLAAAIEEADRLHVEKDQYLDFVRGFYSDRVTNEEKEIEKNISLGKGAKE